MEATEFDSTLGGTEHLPELVNSFKFAISRSVEIAAMTESILHPSKTKLIFQSLPVHMRRRVMSHNAKRLPRKLQKGHLEQLKKSGLPPKQKRPSRKHRRRPANLLEEYNRRQNRCVWLETHIWHAKRFHMIDRWGHRLAYAPCDKAFRACYRASSAHCLLQDISFYTPIKLTGTIQAIKQLFSTITSTFCGLSVGAKAYTTGNRWSEIHLYEPNTYPYGYIGKAEILWEQTNTNTKSMLLFTHPSYLSKIQSILTSIANPSEPDDDITPHKRRKIDKSVEKISVETLSGYFNIFRLTGPNSHSILKNSLSCIQSLEKINANKWIVQYLKNDNHLYLDEKKEYWASISSVSSPSQLSPKMVIGLTVRDPRLVRPTYRTKAHPQTDPVVPRHNLTIIPPFSSTSALWSRDIHKIIKDSVLSNGLFTKHVTELNLVPGEIYEDDPALQSVPIILKQRPGSQDSQYKKLGYGSGWDIIMPPGYALPFWQTFIMFGARAGGLREAENVAFEAGESYLPPDSEAGLLNEEIMEFNLRQRYFKLPPSKRVNYVKLGITSPFRCPWKILLQDWTGTPVNNFYILRDRNLLEIVQECIQKKSVLPQLENAHNCLVAVYLHVPIGSLKNNALICLPKPEDIRNIKSLFEPLHEDKNEKVRRERRKEHATVLKKQRRSRIKITKQIKIKAGIIRKTETVKKDELSEYTKAMRELWLPSVITSVRRINSRETIGFVSKGAFSFTEAHSCGVGYVAYTALPPLLNSGLNKVLVRNTTSNKYRVATINVIKDI